jgi:tetraacyldisaccharide 4'-kinase
MRAPDFWSKEGGAMPRLLSPLSRLFERAAARRAALPGWRAPVPVICCGNATVGGAGKTTLALDLGRRLNARGVKLHFLIRGYGGKEKQSRRVTPGDTAALVGDEALLLAEVAPTWIGGDRAASARAAVPQGAQALIMDDGLQNPTLERDLSLLVIDGATGFGNGQVMPAGPLREPVEAAAARCQAAVLIGEDATGALAQLPPDLPVLRARLRPGPEMQTLAGRRVVAFAGIASPEKFFTSLAEVGANVIERAGFADHHPFTEAEVTRLLERATKADAALVTTPKDAVRLPHTVRHLVLITGVDLEWEDANEIEARLMRLLAEPRQRVYTPS